MTRVTLDLSMPEALALKSAIGCTANIRSPDRGLLAHLVTLDRRLEAEIHRESDESAYCHNCDGHGTVAGRPCIDCSTDA